jgi:hypothetical protein
MTAVTVTVVPETEQAPPPTNVTAPAPLPPELDTVKVEPYPCAVVGTPITVNVPWLASEAEVVLMTLVAAA